MGFTNHFSLIIIANLRLWLMNLIMRGSLAFEGVKKKKSSFELQASLLQRDPVTIHFL